MDMSRFTHIIEFLSEDSNDKFTIRREEDFITLSVFSDAAGKETGHIVLSKEDANDLVDSLLFLTFDWDNPEDESEENTDGHA